MPSQDKAHHHRQCRILQDKMSVELKKSNKLYKLRWLIDWDILESKVNDIINISKMGRNRKDIRTMLGVVMLQAMYNLSDRQTSENFSENNYWQYFCGYEYFEKESIISDSTIRRFRSALGEDGHNMILEELTSVGIKSGLVKKKDLESVIVDTTVQSKNIRHPHDVHLLEKARHHLVSLCHGLGLKLHETYALKFKRAMIKIWQYRSDSKSKQRMKKMKSLKTLLGRLIRRVERELSKLGIDLDAKSSDLISKCKRIHAQSILTSKQKREYKLEGNKVLYSFHATETECIGKGKLHKPYEFGNKVGLAVSGHGNFIVGVKSFHGNPYDGHTLAETVASIENNIKQEVGKIFVDLGYRGNNYGKKGRVYTPSTNKELSASDKKMQKRRSAIEPVIGHLKQYGRMGRNRLKGVIGDIINPLISAIGFNLRSLARKLLKLPAA